MGNIFSAESEKRPRSPRSTRRPASPSPSRVRSSGQFVNNHGSEIININFVNPGHYQFSLGMDGAGASADAIIAAVRRPTNIIISEPEPQPQGNRSPPPPRHPQQPPPPYYPHPPQDVHPPVEFMPLSVKAFVPVRRANGGYDLRSAYPCTVPKRGCWTVKTDLRAVIPEGKHGRITARSGLPLGNQIEVGNEIIDSDYCGNILIHVFNTGNEAFHIPEGECVALFTLWSNEDLVD